MYHHHNLSSQTYSASLRTQASSSMIWLPINQTKFEKYGAAVRSRMYRNIDLSSTAKIKRYNIMDCSNQLSLYLSKKLLINHWKWIVLILHNHNLRFLWQWKCINKRTIISEFKSRDLMAAVGMALKGTRTSANFCQFYYVYFHHCQHNSNCFKADKFSNPELQPVFLYNL